MLLTRHVVPGKMKVTNTVLEKGTAFLTSAGCSAVLLSFCCIAWLSMTHGTESLGVYCLNHVWSHSLQFNQVLMLSQYCQYRIYLPNTSYHSTTIIFCMFNCQPQLICCVFVFCFPCHHSLNNDNLAVLYYDQQDCTFNSAKPCLED